MGEKECPSCGREWPANARRCTCGHWFTPEAEPPPVLPAGYFRPPPAAPGSTSPFGCPLIGCGCLATFILYFGLLGLGMGSRPHDARPGPLGPVIDFAPFWVPMLLISSAAYGYGFALLRSRKVGIAVAVGWTVAFLLLILGTVVFE
jgi:hypothetical protein